MSHQQFLGCLVVKPFAHLTFERFWQYKVFTRATLTASKESGPVDDALIFLSIDIFESARAMRLKECPHLFQRGALFVVA